MEGWEDHQHTCVIELKLGQLLIPFNAIKKVFSSQKQAKKKEEKLPTYN